MTVQAQENLQSAINILAIEDDAADVMLLKRQFTRKWPEAQLTIAASRNEAYRLGELSSYDAVITDLNLPDGSGVDIVHHFRTSNFQIPIVVLTGQGSEDDAVIALKQGASDYVVKSQSAFERLPTLLVRLLGSSETDRALRRTHAELRQSREQFHDYALAVSDWFWETDTENRYTVISAGFRKIVGADAHVRIGHTREELSRPNCEVPDWAALKEAIAQRKPFRDFRYCCHTAGGELRYISESGVPIYDVDLVFKGYRGGGTDVTRAVQAESDLKDANDNLAMRAQELEVLNEALLLREGSVRRSEAKYRLLLEAQPDVMFLLSKDGIFLDAYEPGEIRAFDTSESLIGKTLSSVQPGEVAQQFLIAMEEAFAKGGLRTFEYETYGGDGPRHFECRMIARDPKKVLAIVRDVTERKALEAELVQRRKLDAVGQLTAGVAHDFNNILHVILGSAELLQLETEGSADLIEDLIAASNKGARLTQMLLAYSRRQSLNPSVTNANEVLRGALRMLSRTLGSYVVLKTDLDPDLWTCEVDPIQLETALINLAINARDAMPRGGGLMVTSKNVERGPHGTPQLPDGLPDGQYVRISVADRGTGMSEATLDKAFDPFFTTKDVGEGSGLGLSMVYGFVKQSGGCVNIVSKLGEGTTVNLYFPRTGSVSKAEEETLERVSFLRSTAQT